MSVLWYCPSCRTSGELFRKTVSLFQIWREHRIACPDCQAEANPIRVRGDVEVDESQHRLLHVRPGGTPVRQKTRQEHLPLPRVRRPAEGPEPVESEPLALVAWADRGRSELMMARTCNSCTQNIEQKNDEYLEITIRARRDREPGTRL